MASDVYSSAVIRSMARDFSVNDLIRTIETIKLSGQQKLVENLYSTWIEHNRDNPLLYAVLFNYSVALSELGKLEPARECLERAIELNPDFMPAYINLGRTYERLGKVPLAVVQWSAALARMAAVTGVAVAHKTTALNQTVRTLESANQDEAAENMLRQSLEIDCQQREVAQHLIALRQRQCEWPVILPSERVTQNSLMRAISPLSAAAYTDDPLWQLAIAWHYNRLDVDTPAGAMDSWPRATGNSGPLRIGYLSSDLREHAVGWLMTDVLEAHDRGAVEVFAYYCGPEAKDSLHEHFKNTADHWIPISHMEDEAAARRIAEDGIQILVDLNGYTREARLKVVAHRPAPVIVNWLGFPGTMASPYHHYILADDWIIPPSHEMYYSEKVLRLPCYQPSARNRKVAPQTPTRQEAGLPEKGMVYCCFNGVHKLKRFTLDRWLMILGAVPESVLWLLSSTEGTQQRLREYAAQRGIDPQRLIFAEKLANPYHLARLGLADLFLDTTPYSAHTTASDALWAGVPVLTLSGRSFASRVCGSLLHAAGIPELITTSASEFVKQAIRFGEDPSLLQPFREKLRAGHDSCALFDSPGLVRDLEKLYRNMWDDFENKKRPRPDLANLDIYLEVGSQVNHDEIEVQTIENYHGWWREMLAKQHKFRPVEPDRRLLSDPSFFQNDCGG